MTGWDDYGREIGGPFKDEYGVLRRNRRTFFGRDCGCRRVGVHLFIRDEGHLEKIVPCGISINVDDK